MALKDRTKEVRRESGCGKVGNGQKMALEDFVGLNNGGFLPMCKEDVSEKGSKTWSSMFKDDLDLGWRSN